MSLGFDSYDELQASIAAYIQRTNLNDDIPLFIQLAEVRLRAAIKTMEAQMADPWIVQPARDSDVIPLPTDYGSIAKVMYGGRYLNFISPELIDQQARRHTRGEYSILGGNLYLQTKVDGTELLTVQYYRNLPSLSDANPSNWLLEDYPNLYLFAALVEASAFIMDDDRLPLWATSYSAALQNMQDSDRAARYPAKEKLVVRRG